MLDHKIIAEIGSVHDGSFGNALKLIELAAHCGANLVKFQTHLAGAETLETAPSPSYFRAESRFDYFERTAFTVAQWKALAAHCLANDVEFLSSPFSLEAVDLLEEVGVSAYKIASGEVTNIPLLEHVAKTGKPVLLSSGMSNWAELDQAVTLLQSSPELVVMQCASRYPCPPEKVGLNVIAEMRQRYKLPVGFSDHTTGNAAALAAAALGCVVVEKHLTFSKAMYGSDAANAMEPAEFSAFCNSLKDVWAMQANPVDKDDISDFKDMKAIFEKSIVSAVALESGTVVSFQDLAFKKPGDGIPAKDYMNVVGRKLRRDVPYNIQLKFQDFE